MDALILFPHQLFQSNRTLARGRAVFLVEDALYFRQYPFHQQKLVLHRAAMRAHEDDLRGHGAEVHYLDSAQAPDMATALARVLERRPETLHYIDPVDDWLERRLVREAARAGCRLQRHESAMFLTSEGEVHDYFRPGRRFHMAHFYAHQRKRLGILVRNGRPEGGRWSFDSQNRKRLPPWAWVPQPWRPARNAFVTEAIAYVERCFGGNPGRAADFDYPVTYADAREWLEDFVTTRLDLFGDYQDAILADQPLLFHSALSPMLNVGLLTPAEVMDAVLGAHGIPLNSLEGFVRQVIGWREYVRAAYILVGRRQRTRRFWGHSRPLPPAFWTGKTGIAPIDKVIGRVLRRGYAHHIERLMVLANFMQLCRVDPDDAHRWFMSMFIDAYDWVMVPNVYGMGLHDDGGLIATKPYVSSSSYLLRMSDFEPGDWCCTWDALYWRFIADNRGYFESHPRLSMTPRQLDRMPAARRNGHLENAGRFLAAF